MLNFLCLQQFTFHVNSESNDQFYPKETYPAYTDKITSDVSFNFCCVLILPWYDLQCRNVRLCLHSQVQMPAWTQSSEIQGNDSCEQLTYQVLLAARSNRTHDWMTGVASNTTGAIWDISDLESMNLSWPTPR